MAPIEWTDALSVGVEHIDSQHKKLVGMINGLEAAIASGKSADFLMGIIEEMKEYAKHHFTTEEALLRKHSFPGLDEHLEQHEAFMVKVMEYEFDSDREGVEAVQVLTFLKDWLVWHIQVTDKAYGPYLNERGVD